MKADNFETVFEQILTKSEGERLIEVLDELVSRGEKLNARLLPSALFPLSAKLGENVDLLQLAANLKLAFYQLPVVNLKLAFEPRRTFLAEIKRWFEKNLGEVVTVDLEVNPAIIGGAIIVCNNHYCDFSIERRYAFLLR